MPLSSLLSQDVSVKLTKNYILSQRVEVCNSRNENLLAVLFSCFSFALFISVVYLFSNYVKFTIKKLKRKNTKKDKDEEMTQKLYLRLSTTSLINKRDPAQSSKY